jgi:hypothetical protein
LYTLFEIDSTRSTDVLICFASGGQLPRGKPRCDRSASPNVEHAPPVFAALDRRLCLASNQCVAAVIVGERGFLDPDQPLIVQQAEPPDSLDRREALVIFQESVQASR